jgi:hypothetical protein
MDGTHHQHGIGRRTDGKSWPANYSASKGGQIAFTKSLAREIAARNVTVNAIAPGFVDTEILDAMPPETLEAALKLVPLARKGKPEEIAYAVAFLASDQAAFITGQVLGVTWNGDDVEHDLHFGPFPPHPLRGRFAGKEEKMTYPNTQERPRSRRMYS